MLKKSYPRFFGLLASGAGLVCSPEKTNKKQAALQEKTLQKRLVIPIFAFQNILYTT